MQSMQCSSRGVAQPSAVNSAPKKLSASSRVAFSPRLPVRQQRPRQQIAVQAAPDDRFPRWDFMWRQLNNSKLDSLMPEDAQAMVQDGKAVLIDVRPKDAREKGHPEGSVSAPIFQQMELSSGPSFGKLMKMAAMAANGVQPTEYNPQFLDQVKAAAAGGRAVILACETGGTLESSMNFATGKTSRSLKAAWKVIDSGALPADKVYHLEGGVYNWFMQGLPMVGEYDASNAGKTPNVVGLKQ